MAGRRRLERKTEETRPVVADDFIYDDPSVSDADDHGIPGSDTPEEAIRKLKRRRKDSPDDSVREQEPETTAAPDSTSEKKPVIYSSGIMLDENLMPIDNPGKKEKKSHPVLRGIVLFTVTLILVLAAAAYVLSHVEGGVKALGISDKTISSVVSPVQNFFSGLTETFFGYFRSMKLKANIEEEYNLLREENERLFYQSMDADELRYKLSMYENLQYEIDANANMHLVPCRIVGRSDGNYFSSLTINKGSKDGLKNYMAVVYDGALIGLITDVQEDESTVRTIIDSETSIAGVLQTPRRDQGMVKGTVGSDTLLDTAPTCRMYYLPNDALPRPGDVVVTSGVGLNFPQGIPIGTVTESTRGMSANKQYVIIKPLADFQHLEIVNVITYIPKYPEEIERREETNDDKEFVAVDNSFPPPKVPEIANSLFEDTETPTPDPNVTPSPTPAPTDTPTPVPSPTPSPSPRPAETNLVFQVVSNHGDPTPSPTPTLQPTSTPYITPDPDDMTYEEEQE